MNAKYIFAALSVIFAAAAIGQFIASGGTWPPQTRTWLLIAVIFGTVSVSLFLRD
jgi:hypothetical protein